MTVAFHLFNQVLVLPKAFWMPFERNKGNHNSIHVFVLLVTSFPKDIHAVLGMSLIAGCWLHCTVISLAEKDLALGSNYSGKQRHGVN